MRFVAIFLLVTPAGGFGQSPTDPKPVPRYGIEADVLSYPQATPKDALASVLKAIEHNRINYLLAHLADPQWVDQRVKDMYGGKFDAMVEETVAKLNHDRASIKELQRFLAIGTWQTTEATATATLAEIPNRQVFMKKLSGRWFFESRQQPAETKDS